jgi:hypothetical protein
LIVMPAKILSFAMHRSRVSTVLLFAALLLPVLAYQGATCRSAMGAEIIVTPTCDVREEYNDNILTSALTRKSDFVTTVAPGLSVSRNTERLQAGMSAGMSWITYAHSNGLGSQDYSYQGQLAYKISERDTAGLGGTYVQSSRPDTLSQSTGLASSSGTKSYILSSSAARVLDEVSSASAAYSYQRQLYDDPALAGNITHNVGLGYTRDLSYALPMLKGTVSASFFRAIYSTSTTDDFSLSIGASRNISEKVAWSLSAGGSYTYSNFLASSLSSSPSAAQIGDNLGWVGSAGLTYTGERGLGAVSISRNVVAASGQVGVTENTMINLALGRSETKRFNWHMWASYNINRSSNNQYASSGTDDRVTSLNASALYMLSDYFDLTGQYSYYNDNNRIGSIETYQNKVSLTLSYHDRFRLIGTNTLTNEVLHGTR